MFLALRACEIGRWASWLPFPTSAHPQPSMGAPSIMGLACSNAVWNEIHRPDQRVWREKPLKGKAVLGTESRECFHEGFVLGGEEPSMAEHSLTSGCWPRGEVSAGDLICFPLGSLCGCFGEEMSSAPVLQALCVPREGEMQGRQFRARGRVELGDAALSE